MTINTANSKLHFFRLYSQQRLYLFKLRARSLAGSARWYAGHYTSRHFLLRQADRVEAWMARNDIDARIERVGNAVIFGAIAFFAGYAAAVSQSVQ